MKINNVVQKYCFGALCLLVMASCQKNEIDPNNFETESNTVDKSLGIETERVLHMSFSNNISEAEREERWNKMVQDYKAKNPVSRGSNDFWNYEIRTNTSDINNAGTDGRVKSRVIFNIDGVNRQTDWEILNPAGTTIHRNTWDYYFLRARMSNGASVSKVKARQADLNLLGTNGWHVEDFAIHVHDDEQGGVPASGNSHIRSEPNEWLDSSSSSQSETYDTGFIGTGTLSF